MSICASITSAACSRKLSRPACSSACTSPRCLSGKESAGSRGSAPRTGTPRGARAPRSMASWRGLPTRLKMTPSISTSLRNWLKPHTSAAMEWDCRAQSTTSTTGKSRSRARSAEEPLPSIAPSKSPIMPSATRTRAPLSVMREESALMSSGRMAQGSRLKQSTPLAAL